MRRSACHSERVCHPERMRRIPSIFAVALILLSSAIASAQGPVVGGYDVAKIASATVDVLGAKKVITDAEANEYRGRIASIRPGDPLVAAAPLVELYEDLFSQLVDKGVALRDDITAVKKTAAAGGGLKVDGLNPTVLAASCLDLLARKGILPLAEAQSILESSKVTQGK